MAVCPSLARAIFDSLILALTCIRFGSGRRAMKRHFHELSVAATLAVLLLILAIFAPGFYQLQPLRSLLTRATCR